MKQAFKMWWKQAATYPDGSTHTGSQLVRLVGSCTVMLVIMPFVVFWLYTQLHPMFFG